VVGDGKEEKASVAAQPCCHNEIWGTVPNSRRSRAVLGGHLQNCCPPFSERTATPLLAALAYTLPELPEMPHPSPPRPNLRRYGPCYKRR